MKLILGAAALTLIFSVPAMAQGYFGNYGNVGGGPSLNGGGTLNDHTGYTGVGTHILNNTPVTRFSMSVTNGSSAEFIPSTFVPFEQAVEQGRAALAAKPKTLAEIAAEYRAQKRAKAEVAFVQDNSGKAVTQKQ